MYYLQSADVVQLKDVAQQKNDILTAHMTETQNELQHMRAAIENLAAASVVTAGAHDGSGNTSHNMATSMPAPHLLLGQSMGLPTPQNTPVKQQPRASSGGNDNLDTTLTEEQSSTTEPANTLPEHSQTPLVMHSNMGTQSHLTSILEPAQISSHLTQLETPMFERVELVKGALGLGIHIAGGADAPLEGVDGFGIYITNITAGGAAHMDGRLLVGDELVEVCGQTLEGATHAEAVALLQASSKTVELAVTRNLASSDEKLHEVILGDSDHGLGFGIVGGTDDPIEDGNGNIYINEIIAGGAAQHSGSMMCGDRLVQVGTSVLGSCTHAHAVESLRTASKPVRLVLSRPNDAQRSSYMDSQFSSASQQSTIVENMMEISFRRADEESGFGFCIAGGLDRPIQARDTSVYVTRLIDSGSAHADGRLCVGDRLIEVNGTSLLNVTYDQALRSIVEAGVELKLVISRLPNAVEEHVQISFEKGPGGFGFVFFGGLDQGKDDPAFYVTSIEPTGSAARDGRLQCGDKIVEANGHLFENILHAAACDVFRSSTKLDLIVARLAEPALEKEIVVGITFKPPIDNDFGFSIAGGKDSPVEVGDDGIYITHIVDGGVGQAAGFRFGDRLLTIDDMDLTSTTHDNAVDTLKNKKSACIIQVARLPEDQEEGEQILQIEFARKSGNGLGLMIAGGHDDPVEEDDVAIYVTGVVDGGAAALDGRLRIGDKLLVCNGHCLNNVAHQDAVEHVQANPQGVKLTVSRLADDCV